MTSRARRWIGWSIRILLGLAGVAFVVAHLVVPDRIDRVQTRVIHFGSPDVPPDAAALHERLTIADLHADSLIWGRDLLHRYDDRGQIDVPRLRAANVALQVFAVPTKVPSQRSALGTSGDGLNLITLSALAQWWPPATWWSLASRARYLAGVLDRTAAASGGALVIVRSASDLQHVLAARAPHGPVAGLLAVEGLHALEGDVTDVQRFFDAGFRMMGLVHQFDNALGGSSSGVARGGLTPFGAEVVRAMEARGILVDLAHASPALLSDVVHLSTRPVVVSHTGVRGTCDRPRNLDDEELRLVAGTGGLVGIGYWAGAVCGPGAAAVARAIRYAVGVVGIDHVALGLDFDGDRMPFDVLGLPAVTAALLDAGFSDDDIARIMGGNAIRLLSETLPR